MSAGMLHLVLMGLAGLALLTTVVGGALGFWRIAPSTSHRSQMLIRFGMAVAGVSCFATVLSSVLQGATWRDRVHWELAADVGFLLLSLGLLVGAVTRDIRRRAAGKGYQQGYSASQGD